MIKNKNSERRQYPRLEHRLPLYVAANGYDFITSTQNVSCLGAYCRINKYVPPFTRVMVKLTLPVMSKKENKNFKVECSGVVVRTDDINNGGFNIAIYFNRIAIAQRKKISQYINQFLPEGSSCKKSPQPRWAG